MTSLYHGYCIKTPGPIEDKTLRATCLKNLTSHMSPLFISQGNTVSLGPFSHWFLGQTKQQYRSRPASQPNPWPLVWRPRLMAPCKSHIVDPPMVPFSTSPGLSPFLHSNVRSHRLVWVAIIYSLVIVYYYSSIIFLNYY